MAQHGILAVDGGQSELRLRVSGAGPEPLILPGVMTSRPVLPQLAAAIETAVERCGQSFEGIAIGTTGLTAVEHDAAALKRLLKPGVCQRIYLAHDSVSSYLGALGERHGVVIAAGTGVVVLGVGARRVARVDGWGNIMGDAGSGYWIGQKALDAVMRAHDGRGPNTALTRIVEQRWPDLEQAYIQLQSDPDRIAVVASFAQQVAQLADRDAVSARIIEQAAGELAHSTATALKRCSLDGVRPAQVACLGGVLQGAAMRRAYRNALERLAPQAVIVASRGQGLDGIELMPQLPDGHPLHQMISQA